jgi:hypothetical protein
VTGVSILARWFDSQLQQAAYITVLVATLGRWQAGPVVVAMIERRHLLVATVNSRKWTFHGKFFKTFHHGRKLKRLIVEDKIIPTPIDFNRVGIVLSSNVDSCSIRTVRIFNITSLHFGERGGTKLATLHCYVGSLASRPGRSSNSRTTLTHCYCYPQ